MKTHEIIQKTKLRYFLDKAKIENVIKSFSTKKRQTKCSVVVLLSRKVFLLWNLSFTNSLDTWRMLLHVLQSLCRGKRKQSPKISFVHVCVYAVILDFYFSRQFFLYRILFFYPATLLIQQIKTNVFEEFFHLTHFAVMNKFLFLRNFFFEL